MWAQDLSGSVKGSGKVPGPSSHASPRGCWTQDREEEGNIPVWLPGRCLGALQQGSRAGEAGKVPLAWLAILT